MPLYPSVDETLLRPVDLDSQQHSLLSTWFQPQAESSHPGNPMQGKSLSRKSLECFMPQLHAAASEDLPDLSRSSAQKTHSTPGPVGCLRDGRERRRPSQYWVPGPTIDTSTDLCCRARLLSDYVRELRRRPSQGYCHML